MTIRLTQLRTDPQWFPPLESALSEPDGLLAFGGDLSPSRLESAYRHGIFPWFNADDPLLWWSPTVRAVFAPQTLQLNRTLRKEIRRHQLWFSCNLAFSRVIAACADPRAKQAGTWIQPCIQQAYQQLHQQGLAHSIEVWQGQQLVGGLYGLQIGELFCGESMFNTIPNTAKIALCLLQHHLAGFTDGWIDCQMPNPFLLSMGATPLHRDDYVVLLNALKDSPVQACRWQPRRLELDSD